MSESGEGVAERGLTTTDERRPRRAGVRLWDLLDRPAVWSATRIVLDAAFGVYRKRRAVLEEWGVLAGGPSVLDIGCGIGQFAALAEGDYLGIDVNEHYIRHAQRRHRDSGKAFRAMDVRELLEQDHTYDVVVMVDFLHHLDDEGCLALLSAARRLARRHVASFEPITEQTNRAGRWIVTHDRGAHVRPLAELYGLMDQAGLRRLKEAPVSLGPIGTRAVLAAPPSA